VAEHGGRLGIIILMLGLEVVALSWRCTAMSLMRELLDAERQGWHALMSAEGARYYREHLTDDAVMVFSSGVMTRAEALEAMASAPRGGLLR
jgi:hypothetical protein